MRFNKQKMLSGVLATGLALSCMVGPAFAAGTSLKDAIKDTQTQVEAGLVFSDVKQGDWYYDAVMDMTKMGLFAGTGGGKFSPNNTMTCGEFLTVVVRYLYNDELQSMGAVPQGAHWADNARLVALDNDIINNNEIDASDLSRNMTRKEMAMVLVRAADANGESKPVQIDSSKVIDYNSIGTYYRSFVIDAISRGLIAGTSADASSHTLTFSPEGVLTRGQAATVLYRFAYPDERTIPDLSAPVEKPGSDLSQPITIYEGQTRVSGESRLAREGDIFVKADGTKVVLKKGPNGVLGEGQGVAPDLGFKGTSEGGLYNEVINQERFSPGPVLGDYYSNSIGEPYNNDTYKVNPWTGEGHWDTEWTVIIDANPMPATKGTYNGQISTNGVWVWLADYNDWDLCCNWPDTSYFQ